MNKTESTAAERCATGYTCGTCLPTACSGFVLTPIAGLLALIGGCILLSQASKITDVKARFWARFTSISIITVPSLTIASLFLGCCVTGPICAGGMSVCGD